MQNTSGQQIKCAKYSEDESKNLQGLDIRNIPDEFRDVIENPLQELSLA